jgi:hypothetical protein
MRSNACADPDERQKAAELREGSRPPKVRAHEYAKQISCWPEASAHRSDRAPRFGKYLIVSEHDLDPRAQQLWHTFVCFAIIDPLPDRSVVDKR